MNNSQFDTDKVAIQRAHFESIYDCQTLDQDGLMQYLLAFFIANKEHSVIFNTEVTPGSLSSATAQQCFEDLKQERISYDTFLAWIAASS
jgi:hypothetical protein